MDSSFFAMMSRMKHIERWALMRNTMQENLCEHSLQVAMIAHALALISNSRFGNHLDASKAALIGMYHDASEIITGDMPTPVKYRNPEIQGAFKEIEESANKHLISMLPKDLQPFYSDILLTDENDSYLWKLVKAADKLSAYIKCVEEGTTGNLEFESARETTERSIHNMNLPEAEVFLDEFLSAFGKNLDQLMNNPL